MTIGMPWKGPLEPFVFLSSSRARACDRADPVGAVEIRARRPIPPPIVFFDLLEIGRDEFDALYLARLEFRPKACSIGVEDVECFGHGVCSEGASAELFGKGKPRGRGRK